MGFVSQKTSPPVLISKAHTWSAAVLIDELNTSFLKGGAYLLHGCLSPS